MPILGLRSVPRYCSSPSIANTPAISIPQQYRRPARSTSLPRNNPLFLPALVSALFVPLFTSGGFAAYLRCGHLPRFSILGSGSCLLFTSGGVLLGCLRGVGRSIWRYFYRHYPHCSSSVAPIANRHPTPAFPVIPFGDFIAALSVLPRRYTAIPLYRYTEPPTPRRSCSRGYSREPFFSKNHSPSCEIQKKAVPLRRILTFKSKIC